jgi:hypothetical protein
MEPLATEVERITTKILRECAPAEPRGRLKHQHSQPVCCQPSRGADAGGASPYDDDVEHTFHEREVRSGIGRDKRRDLLV